MKAYQIIQYLNKFCPPQFAESWDNVGLLCGSPQKEIKKIFATLDMTLQTVTEAAEWGADMIVSHHPILFHGLKQVDFETEEGKILVQLIQNEIVAFAAHTNLDVAPEGINQVLAELFELEQIEVLEKDSSDDRFGLGRVGYLKTKRSLAEVAQQAKALLKTPYVRVCGDLDRDVYKIVIVSGSGGDRIPLAVQEQADVFLTADMKYHEALDAVAAGISIIDAGHYPTEQVVMELFKKKLEQSFQGIAVKCSAQKDVFQYV